MKKRKLMMTVMSLALVLVVAIGGTLAYLSDQSNQVVNTFNVGNGYEEEENPDDPNHPHKGLWLDEVDWDGPTDNEGNLIGRTEEGNEYKELMPGSVVAKDPTFHLTDGSTTSYVFAKVTGVDAMVKDNKYFFTVTKPESLKDPGKSEFNPRWEKVEGDGFDGWYVYVVNSKALEDEAHYGVVGGAPMAPMFNYVKLGSDVDNDGFAKIDPGTVEIKGVAVQTANLTMKDAFEEAKSVLQNQP